MQFFYQFAQLAVIVGNSFSLLTVGQLSAICRWTVSQELANVIVLVKYVTWLSAAKQPTVSQLLVICQRSVGKLSITIFLVSITLFITKTELKMHTAHCMGNFSVYSCCRNQSYCVSLSCLLLVFTILLIFGKLLLTCRLAVSSLLVTCQ